jgi:hypothetical protein
VLFIGTLNKQLAICKVDSQGNVIGGQPGCYNLIPVFDWIRRCIISIFMVFFIAFLPLFLQGRFHLYHFVHTLTPHIRYRTNRAWYRKGFTSSRKAFPFAVPNFRSLLHANILAGHPEQFDIRRCPLHRYWQRLCDHSYIIQHLILPLCRSQHLYGDAEPPPPPLCYHVDLHSTFDLLLVLRTVTLRRPLHFQPAPVLVHRLHR